MGEYRKNDGSTTIKGADGKIATNVAGGALGGPGYSATVGPVRVADAVQGYQQQHRPEEDGVDWSVLADYVADVLHYADSQGIDPEQVLRVAQSHYYEEVEESREAEAAPAEAVEPTPAPGAVENNGPTPRHLGSKYTGYRPAKEVAVDVRKDVKELRRQGVIPDDVKVSVRSQTFTGGQAVDVTLSGWTRDRIIREDEFRGTVYTDEAQAIMDAVEGARESYNRDDSEPMVDYFHVTYYGSTDWDLYYN